MKRSIASHATNRTGSPMGRQYVGSDKVGHINLFIVRHN